MGVPSSHLPGLGRCATRTILNPSSVSTWKPAHVKLRVQESYRADSGDSAGTEGPNKTIAVVALAGEKNLSARSPPESPDPCPVQAHPIKLNATAAGGAMDGV